MSNTLSSILILYPAPFRETWGPLVENLVFVSDSEDQELGTKARVNILPIASAFSGGDRKYEKF